MTASRSRAMRVTEPGGPLVLETVPAPLTASDEVTVRMRYAGVNPQDRAIRSATALSAAGLPRTLGVEGVGEFDGSWFLLYGGGLGISRDGTWAQYVSAPREALVPVPAGLDLRVAACAGVVGATAVRVVCGLAEVTADDRVLVLGAGGGTGCAITSLARSRGAAVWGHVGSPAKATAVARTGGVPLVADSASALREQVADLGITVAFDPLGGDFTSMLVDILSPDGTLIHFGTAARGRASVPLRPVYSKNLTLRGYGALGQSWSVLRSAVGTALSYFASGAMSVPIDRVLPLADAELAMKALSNREITGKLVLDTR